MEEPQVSSYTQFPPVGLPFEQIVFRVARVWEAAELIVDNKPHLQLKSPPRWRAHDVPHDSQHPVDVVLQTTNGCTRSFGHWGFYLRDKPMVSAWRHTWSAKHQVSIVLADQDDSRLSLVN